MTTLGVIPVPVQMMSSGASAKTGTVCDAMRNGYMDRSRSRDQNIAVAMMNPNDVETMNPTMISRSVTHPLVMKSAGSAKSSRRICETGW